MNFQLKYKALSSESLWQALRREADGRSLVLLDEVGTGTDPGEGAALGIALLRALAAGGARGAAVTLATTHHRCRLTPIAGLCVVDCRMICV